MTLDLTAILLEVFPFLENCVKTELKTLMILEISLQKKIIPNCNGLIYYSRPEIETSEMDCQAPARFSFSSFFHFFFLLYLGKKQFPYSHRGC